MLDHDVFIDNSDLGHILRGMTGLVHTGEGFGIATTWSLNRKASPSMKNS
jgi:hypothetical protein